MENCFSLSSMEKLLKNSGAPRVSDKAKEEFAKALEDIGIRIGKKAVNYAEHAGRKTVKSEDIILANR